jgi:hypothetical protein
VGWIDEDIGWPALAGSASYDNGVWTISGSGMDIWNFSDEFHYAYTPTTENCVIIANVRSLDYTDIWAKAGVMFRDDNSGPSMFAMVVATPANGIAFQWRDSTGGQCSWSGVGGAAPMWVKLWRAGNVFSAYSSADGTTWNQIGTETTIPMTSSGLVGLAVTAHNPSALCTAVISDVTISNAAPPAPRVTGAYREVWPYLDSSQGNTLTVLTNTMYNPSWPDFPDPAYTRVLSSFETPSNIMDYYGQRVRAFVVPPTNGSYTFWIASDDMSQLFLSSDESPASVISLASVATWANSREWTKEAGQQSAPVPLEAGRRYYIEAIMQDGNGGDNLAVRWQLPNGTMEEPLPGQSDIGTRLFPFTGQEALPGVYEQTTNVTVVEGATATFFVVSSNGAPLSYRWRQNGTPINTAAAAKSVYAVSNVTMTMNGHEFTCQLSNSQGLAYSSPARLWVLGDTNPPTIVRGLNSGLTNVLVVFSETVELASATKLPNYVFTNGLQATAAVLSADNSTAVLTTPPLVYGSNYTILVSGVRDRSTTPNTIAPNTPARFGAMPYTPQDIGPASSPAIAAIAGNGIDMTSWGRDIGGSADQFTLSYQLRTGDFDVGVRLDGLSPSDVWAKAGLMARETLDPSSRFAAALATPAMVGSFFQWRDPAGTGAASAGSFPVNYPMTWLRLKRAGNVFTGFAGYDGQSWTQLGSRTISMPAQIYFGLALSSHNQSQPAVARFRDIAEVSGAVLATFANPYEPPGPSSRKTPLVFSEIMYKPAVRTDTHNLEFVEVYNSNPWFEDLSGYRLAGDSISYTFPAGSVLPGGGLLVVAAAPDSLRQVYGITALGPYTGSLKKDSTLELRDERNSLLLKVQYADVSPWPIAADGTGHSLVLARPTYGEDDPRAWDISDVRGGSPGSMDAFRPSPLRNIVINEYLAHTDFPEQDFIELYNHSTQTVSIAGCVLTDDIATNKFVIPANTTIGPRGFIYFTEATLKFALSSAGETVYFINPAQSRVVDAIRFEGQENGVSSGRWPDGATDFYRLSSKTPGNANQGIRISDVVINELMYHPMSNDDDDQYIELHNQGTTAVNLGGWTIDGGIRHTFATNTVLSPGGHLVLARNAGRLRTNYANLNLANCVGDFSGRLSHSGERLALTMPDLVVSTNSSGGVSTNLIHITVDEVTYADGGRWGQWADGGGSSLELIDPRANDRLPSNWGDSDETQKSVWTNIEATGVLDYGANIGGSIGYAQLGLLETGECLVDNVEVRPGGGQNLVLNPDFESGSGSWDFQGDHRRSTVESPGYAGSSRSLCVRASDRLWTGANSCQVALSGNSLGEGQFATLRLKARWLRGWPEILFRLNGNWLEATGRLPVPQQLGTPGARNSRYAANIGPAVHDVVHQPAVPPANQAVVVTARVQDPDGVSSRNLNYRIDPSSTYVSVAMKDDGTAGDEIAGDGLFSATIPAQNGGTIVAFYLSATDTRGATTRFPAPMVPNDIPPDCVVMFGDGTAGGCFPVYHLWITRANADLWSSLSDLSNETFDCTIVNGTRVIYNARARFAGSPYHQNFDTPYGSLCHYKWVFPNDDKFLGATSFNKLHQPGNGAGDDQSLQREQTANTFLRALGQPWLYRHLVAVYVNGVRRGHLMEDAQTPDADVVEQNFSADSEGWLYKMQPWFEFQPFDTYGFNNYSWCAMMPYLTTGGEKKKARYRWNFMVRRTPVSANDYTNVFSMVDAASTYGEPNYVANMEKLADMENWLRVFAANHAAGNWDAYGSPNSQNLYGYIGTKGTRYTLLMFDFNIVLGNISWGPGQNLFAGNGEDPNTQNIFNEPAFRRMYWRALGELVAGPLDVAKTGPLLDAKYNAMIASGVNPENPNSIKNWLTSARTAIASQIAAENTGTFTVNTSVTLNNNIAFITGTAPFNVKTIRVNGFDYPVKWTSVTAWSCAVPLKNGQNVLSVGGVDIRGQPVAGATGFVSVNYAGVVSSPVGQVVINEVMHDPLVPGAEYVELFNASTSTAFDLSGYRFNGLAYTFPSGSLIAPNSYLVLAGDRGVFAAIYGVGTPLFGSYDGGNLQKDGETLTLLQQGTNATPDTVIAKIRYRNSAPWSTAANGTGSSFQLTDPKQDNWRAGNWAAVPANGLTVPQWFFAATNIPATSSRLHIYLESSGDIYIDDLKLVKAPAASVLNNGGFDSTLAGTWNVGSSFSQSTISSVVKRAGAGGLHLVATGPGSAGPNSVYQDIIPAVASNQVYTLSFWYLQSANGGPLTVRLAGSANPLTVYPAPSITGLAPATPGAPNSVLGALTPFPSLWLNEVQAENLTGPTNSAGQRTSWLELYNPTTNTISLDSVYLSANYTNPGAWALPSTATVGPKEFKLIFADGATNLNSPTELHAGFTLPAGAGSLALTRLTTNAQFQVLDYLDYTNLPANRSYGSFPDGQCFFRQEFAYPTAAGTNNGSSAPLSVVINEWMAANTFTLRDPVTGKYEDWFELYNFGTSPADLAGYYLTDTLTNQFKVLIRPGYVIPPRGFLLVWADGKITNGTPDLHVNFNLDKDGESIGLYGADGRPIDYVTFGLQAGDVSRGRFPDGASSIYSMPKASPGTNNALANTPPVLDTLRNWTVTAGQTVSFFAQAHDSDLPAQVLTYLLAAGSPPGAAINPTTGFFTWTPPSVGSAAITVLVWDDGIPNLSASGSFTVTVVSPPQLGELAVLSGNRLAFTLSTLSGESYQLEYTPSLAVTAWLPVGNPIVGTGDVLSVTNVINVSGNAFYRVRLLP